MVELINLIICSFGGYLCMCRIVHIDRKTKLAIRSRYVMWFLMFAASGFSFVFGVQPGLGQMLFGLAVIADLALGFGAWKNGAPKYTRISHG